MPRRGPKKGKTTITPGGLVKTATYLPPELRDELAEYVHAHRKDGATLSSVLVQAAREFLASRPKK